LPHEGFLFLPYIMYSAYTHRPHRNSTLETQAEDEHEQAMTHSLIIAHQCTVDTLEKLEDEEDQQSPNEKDDNPLQSGALPSPVTAQVLRLPARDKPSRSPRGDPILNAEKRASIWINDLVFDSSPLPSGFRRQTWGDRECSMFLEQQPYYLLQKWTDQGETLGRLEMEGNKESQEWNGGAAPTSAHATDFNPLPPPKFSWPKVIGNNPKGLLRERRGFKRVLSPDSLSMGLF